MVRHMRPRSASEEKVGEIKGTLVHTVDDGELGRVST